MTAALDVSVENFIDVDPDDDRRLVPFVKLRFLIDGDGIDTAVPVEEAARIATLLFEAAFRSQYEADAANGGRAHDPRTDPITGAAIEFARAVRTQRGDRPWQEVDR